MSVLVALAVAGVLWALIMSLRVVGEGLWLRSVVPAMAVVVLGLPLLDHSLRHLALPLFFEGSGYLLIAALLGLLYLRPAPRLAFRFDLLGWTAGVVLLAWLLMRGIAPAFDSFGENIFSLRYVQSLRLATVYPAADLWEAAPSVAGYYTWIHNIAAWYARAFLLPVPLAIHLATASLLALMSLALYEAFATRAQAGVAALGSAVVMAAGTGTALLLGRSIHDTNSIMLGYPHVRLFGMRPDEFPQSWMATLAETNPELPVETPLHVAIYLGDFHPPLLGFALIALLVWAVAQHARWPSLLPLLLGAFPALVWTANPWFLPHALALSGGLMALDAGLRRQWRSALIGLLASAAVVAPILMQADFRAVGVSFVALPAALRSTPLALMVIWLPALLLAVAALIARDGRWHWWLWLAVLIASMEFIHFNQGDMAGSGARFNGVLKVWSPLHFLVLALGVLGAVGLKGKARWAGLLALPLVVGAGIHARDLARVQVNKQQLAFEWSAAGKLTQRVDRAFLLRELQARQPGRTLERLARPQYDLAPLTSTLAGLPTVSGWAHHMSQASGDAGRENLRVQKIEAWYNGRDPQPLTLLQAWGVDAVLVDWDANWNATRLASMQRALAPHFLWLDGPGSSDARPSGLFIRLDTLSQ